MPPAPSVELVLPIRHQCTRADDQSSRIPAVRTVFSRFSHSFLISFISSLPVSSRQEGYNLHSLTETHVVPKYTSTLVYEELMQEFGTLHLVISKPLGDRCLNQAQRVWKGYVSVRRAGLEQRKVRSLFEMLELVVIREVQIIVYRRELKSTLLEMLHPLVEPRSPLLEIVWYGPFHQIVV